MWIFDLERNKRCCFYQFLLRNLMSYCDTKEGSSLSGHCYGHWIATIFFYFSKWFQKISPFTDISVSASSNPFVSPRKGKHHYHLIVRLSFDWTNDNQQLWRKCHITFCDTLTFTSTITFTHSLFLPSGFVCRLSRKTINLWI